MATHTLQIVTLVEHPPVPTHSPSKDGKVQLLPGAYKDPAELAPGERGLLCVPPPGVRTFDPDTFDFLQRTADVAVIRQAYDDWYRQSGRVVEKEMLKHWKQLAGERNLLVYVDSRFRQIIRRGLDLEAEADDTEDEDGSQPSNRPDKRALLQCCRDAVNQHRVFDGDQFINLHRLLLEASKGVHKKATKATVRAAIGRQNLDCAPALERIIQALADA